MSILEQENTRKQGDVGVGYAIAYFMAKGYIVSLPITESTKYDLIVDINNKLNRVQVKTTRYVDKSKKSKPFVAVLKTNGGNQSGKGKTHKFNEDNDIDLLFILTANETKYLIPCVDITNTSSIALGKDKEKYIIE